MFRHILVPTDGSPGSQAAAAAAIEMAAESGARITALHVLPDFHVFSYSPEMLEDTRDKFMHDSMAHAGKLLEGVVHAARERGVPCESVLARGDRPHRKILGAAGTHGCDLIAMASHGQLGLKGVLLGSETHKVLVHSPVPVLVFRAE
jgi:nucleotide-binding universal stress UspA family protein